MHPGIPTWLIACHRFTRDLNWLRGALFVDDRKTAQHIALVEANDDKRYVDFTVRGPFPPTLMTLLVDGFLDTIQRRYSGLEMERKVPCPEKGEGSSCTHYFKVKNLENRLTQNPPILKIECEECGTTHEVARLLLGLSLLPEVEELTAEEMRRVVREEGEKTREMLEQGVASIKEYMQLQFVKEWNAQQMIETDSCPTVFSLYSLDGGSAVRTSKLRLQFYCMKPGCWHSAGEKGRREFEPPREWAVGTMKFLRSFGAVLRPMATIGAALVHPAAALGIGIGGAETERIRKDFETTAKLLVEWEKLSPGMEKSLHPLEGESRAPSAHGETNLADLKKFLETLFTERKGDGSIECGLERVRTPENHIMWLCAEHAKEYRR